MEETIRQQPQTAAEAQLAAEQKQQELQREALKDMAKEQVKSAARREMNRVVSQMLPDEVNRLRWAGLARNIPVVSDVVQWLDNVQWLRRLLTRREPKA